MNKALLLKILNRIHLPEWLKYYLTESDVHYPLVNNPEEAWEYLISLHSDPKHSCIFNHNFGKVDCDLEIVVPCYNVEQYVEECLDSILAQKTQYTFFVTIVNDGSTDGTGKILRKYEANSNVKVITQKNKGHSGARNTAIRQLHGRYVLFVDSDDILCPGAVENFLNIAIKYDSDIVDAGHIRFSNQWWYNLIQKPQVHPDAYLTTRVTGYPCGKVLRRSILPQVEFPEGYWFEDTVVWMILEPLAKRKSMSSFVAFRYRMNPNSISHTAGGQPKALDSLYVTMQLLRDRKKLGITDNQDSYESFLNQMRMNFFRIQGLGAKVRQAVFAVQSKLLQEAYANFKTDNPSVKPIQDTMRSGDYNGFYRWVQLH